MAQAKLAFETTNDTSKAEKSFGRITAAAKRANAEIKRDGVQVAEELGKKNQETFKAMLGRFAPVAAAVAVLSAVIRKVSEAFAKMAESGKQLRETADAIGVSAQTVGRLKAQADAAGISAKDYAKALDEVKSGATSIDELSAAWARVAKETRGAKEANAAFAEAMRKNFEDIAQSKNIEKLNNAINGAFRWVASGLVDIVGADSNAETTLEYGLAKGIREGRGKDAVIRRAIQSQTYSPVEGTAMWRARYAELEALFDKRAAEIDSERQASTDRRIAGVYDKLGGNAALAAEALAQIGLKGLTASAVEAAVSRNIERDPRKAEEKLIKDLLANQTKQQQAEAAREAKQKAREDSIQKASISYAYAQGGGLLAGINYGFLQATKDTIAQDQLKQLTKQTASLTKMVEQLQRVNKALADD